MGWLQKFVTGVLPRRWAAAIEAESRAWVMRCPCGHETSVWEAGGIRYKAAGNPVRLARCPRCGLTLHRLHKRPATSAGGRVSNLMRLWTLHPRYHDAQGTGTCTAIASFGRKSSQPEQLRDVGRNGNRLEKR